MLRFLVGWVAVSFAIAILWLAASALAWLRGRRADEDLKARVDDRLRDVELIEVPAGDPALEDAERDAWFGDAAAIVRVGPQADRDDGP
jgi:hypothetical protein